jgi:adenine phosphoribosyltransferase|tara:strand:+ start:547 stop:1074 length:528 start_codon:yes stop_codon:yes gene_type:complete
MISDRLEKVIRTVPNFPKDGISFKDITPLLMDKILTDEIIDVFVKKFSQTKIDAIVGIESRGFLYGFLLANKLGVPFVPIRKSGKLPCKTLKYKYDLEYGSSEMEIHSNDIQKDWNVLVHDDLLATGGTACAAAELIKMAHANVVGFAFIVSLSYLNPYRRLNIYSNNIISLLDY